MPSSVIRATRILDLLSTVDKPLTLKQISEELSLPKSTAHGILRDLVRESFVELHEPVSYAIGLKAFEVGSAYLRRVDAVGVAQGELVHLTRTLNVTAHYAVLDASDAVYLCKQDPPGLGIQLASSVGARLPACRTAVGKACLAWFDAASVTKHLGDAGGADALGGSPGSLGSELAAIRAAGFAIDEGEAALGIQCVAAPVFDVSGPCGAIGVSYLIGAQMPLETVTAEVVSAATRVSSMLGGRVQR